jgi:hypothetical protein
MTANALRVQTGEIGGCHYLNENNMAVNEIHVV